VAAHLTRIISDLHYGEHACRVGRLEQLRPLLANVDHLVLNGDALDTRPGPRPDQTAERIAKVRAFFPGTVGNTTFLTGNHDADFSARHFLDLGHDAVFVTHGDIFFDDIVPWSQDAPLIRRELAAEFGAAPPHLRHDLAHRYAVFRRVAGRVPQRHQSEPNRLKYALRYLLDTVWPPMRLIRVVQTWRVAPHAAMALTRLHRPRARFVVYGHTHRPGIWRGANGLVAINTGSFCPPLSGQCVDLTATTLTVRPLEYRGGEVRPGAPIAEFPLAESGGFPKTVS